VRSRRSLGVEIRFSALFRLRAQPAAGANNVNNVKEPFDVIRGVKRLKYLCKLIISITSTSTTDPLPAIGVPVDGYLYVK
jgi:hypothetical protein